jgi:hypothetical protein
MQVLQNMFSQIMSTLHFENVPMKQHAILQISPLNIDLSESMLSMEDLLSQVKEWRSTLECEQHVSSLECTQDVSRQQPDKPLNMLAVESSDNTVSTHEGQLFNDLVTPAVELPAGKFSDLLLSSSLFGSPICEQSNISTLNFCQLLHPQHECYLPPTLIKRCFSSECGNLLKLVSTYSSIHDDKPSPTDLNYLKFQFAMQKPAPTNSELFVTLLRTEVINIYFSVSRVKLKMENSPGSWCYHSYIHTIEH